MRVMVREPDPIDDFADGGSAAMRSRSPAPMHSSSRLHELRTIEQPPSVVGRSFGGEGAMVNGRSFINAMQEYYPERPQYDRRQPAFDPSQAEIYQGSHLQDEICDMPGGMVPATAQLAETRQSGIRSSSEGGRQRNQYGPLYAQPGPSVNHPVGSPRGDEQRGGGHRSGGYISTAGLEGTGRVVGEDSIFEDPLTGSNRPAEHVHTMRTMNNPLAGPSRVSTPRSSPHAIALGGFDAITGQGSVRLNDVVRSSDRSWLQTEGKATPATLLKNVQKLAPKRQKSEQTEAVRPEKRTRRGGENLVKKPEALIDVDDGDSVATGKKAASYPESAVQAVRRQTPRRRARKDNDRKIDEVSVFHLDGNGDADGEATSAAGGKDAQGGVVEAEENDEEKKKEEIRARWANFGKNHLSVNFEDVRKKVLEKIAKFVELQSYIHTLNLDYCGLTCGALAELLPGIASEFTSLEEVSIDQNRLEDIPELTRFAVLTGTIKRLSLQTNLFCEVPPAICALENLTSLNLSRNRITSVPVEVFQLSKLKTVNLCENEISSLPIGIGSLKHLKLLRLDTNKLTSLPDDIGRDNPALTTLDISENSDFYGGIPSGMHALKDQLTEFFITDTELYKKMPRKMRELVKGGSEAATVVNLAAGKTSSELDSHFEEQRDSGRKGRRPSKALLPTKSPLTAAVPVGLDLTPAQQPPQHPPASSPPHATSAEEAGDDVAQVVDGIVSTNRAVGGVDPGQFVREGK